MAVNIERTKEVISEIEEEIVKCQTKIDENDSVDFYTGVMEVHKKWLVIFKAKLI